MLNIIEVLEDKALLGQFLEDPGTWGPWFTFLRSFFGLPPTEARHQDGRPQVAPVVSVDDLDPLAAREFCRCEDKPELERAFRRSREQRHTEITRDLGQLAPLRPGQPHVLPELAEPLGEFDALVICTAALEQ